MDLLGFEALVMTASAVGVGSRKEEKSKKAECIERGTIGMLYKTRARNSGVMRISG